MQRYGRYVGGGKRKRPAMRAFGFDEPLLAERQEIASDRFCDDVREEQQRHDREEN